VSISITFYKMFIKKAFFRKFITYVFLFGFYVFGLIGLIHASSSGELLLKNVFVLPNLDVTRGVVVELLDFSKTNQGGGDFNAIRYAWKNGDFIFEKGMYTSRLSNSLSVVYSARGRFKGKIWEYSKSSLIEHGVSNTYQGTVSGKTAHEINFLQYLAKGMEVDDFETIRVTTNGSFYGKWLSTKPVQLMTGNLEFLDPKKVLLKAWTPERLVQFESEFEYDFTISRIVPASIRFRHIVDGVPSIFRTRKVVFADLNESDAEFDPRLRYNFNRILQMEGDVLSETNGAGKKVVYIKSNPTEPPSKVRGYFVVLIFLISSIAAFIWLKTKI